MAAQRKAVEDYLNGGRWKLVGEFTEVESGPLRAPELEKALTACRSAPVFQGALARNYASWRDRFISKAVVGDHRKMRHV
jgi:hypothetical protein